MIHCELTAENGCIVGAPVATEQVDFVDDQQAHFLHVGAILPVAGDAVPLLGRCNDEVRRLQRPAPHSHRSRTASGSLRGASSGV